MPELPETEVILDQLRKNILGSTISGLRIERKDIIRAGISSWPWYIGSQISDISRNGKSIVLSCAKATKTRLPFGRVGDDRLVPSSGVNSWEDQTPPYRPHIRTFKGISPLLLESSKVWTSVFA